MPKKYSTEEIREDFERYGYTLPENFVYRNNTTPISVIDEQTGRRERLTLKQLRYRINNGRSEYDFPQYINMSIDDNEPKYKLSFDRFRDKQDDYFKNETSDFQQEVFQN